LGRTLYIAHNTNNRTAPGQALDHFSHSIQISKA
jgi:hypothetical protein